MKPTTGVFSVCLLLCASQQALSWGDDGRKTIALIAPQCRPDPQPPIHVTDHVSPIFEMLWKI